MAPWPHSPREPAVQCQVRGFSCGARLKGGVGWHWGQTTLGTCRVPPLTPVLLSCPLTFPTVCFVWGPLHCVDRSLPQIICALCLIPAPLHPRMQASLGQSPLPPRYPVGLLASCHGQHRQGRPGAVLDPIAGVSTTGRGQLDGLEPPRQNHWGEEGFPEEAPMTALAEPQDAGAGGTPGGVPRVLGGA